jgi:methyltransferase (TIGR00027 family)
VIFWNIIIVFPGKWVKIHVKLKGGVLMNQKQMSTAAESVAIVRAIEALRPAGTRICYDPIAKLLVSSVKVFLSNWFIDAGFYNRLSKPGTIEFIVARERYIDDYLRECLNDGIDQIVILGAGFDTRAYRINGIDKVRVFEVDSPVTQEVKKERLKMAIGQLPGNVTFVPADLDAQDLGERLVASGYDESAKTLFIWQGVTVYMTSDGVYNTLRFIANHSAKGSSVIFDYFYTETLKNMKIKTKRSITGVMGEGLIFGIDKGKVEPLLGQLGFKEVHSADSNELKRLYFIGSTSLRPIADGIAIVSARVEGYKG